MAVLLLLQAACVVDANATVDCGPYRVAAIQAQSTDVLVAFWAGPDRIWKSLGSLSLPATKPYMALAQQALATGQQVSLRYADGHVCANTDYGGQPMMLRLEP